jgi:hypothetical protein
MTMPDATPEDSAPKSATAAGADGAGDADAADGTYRIAEPAAVRVPEPSSVEAGSTFQLAADAERLGNDEVPQKLPAVDEVWNRWAEWKQPLLCSGAVVAVGILIELWPDGTSALFVLAGLVYGLYHIVISLEVPVRVTAEQAIREFYAALGHRLPNYRRMYCLLTTDAKHSAEFSDFASFRSYWHRWLKQLATSSVWLRPLEFRVDGCKFRYNAEKTFAVSRYKLQVFRRDRPAGEPLADLEVSHALVKGPDGQWYLNSGTVPGHSDL